MSSGAPRLAPFSPRVLIVIVNYRTAALTQRCLASIEKYILPESAVQVVVVENASGEYQALCDAIVAAHWGDWVSVLPAPRNGGFAYGNNRAIEVALRQPSPPDYFLLLNPDTEVQAGAVRALVDYLHQNPDVGIAGSNLQNEDGSPWSLAFRFPSVWSELEQGIRSRWVSTLLKKKIVAVRMGTEPALVDWVSGASMMIRAGVLQDIGLFDDGYFLYFEEVDYCLRAHKRGWKCAYVPASRVTHLYGRATGMAEVARAARRMPRYWFDSRTRYFVKNHGGAYARLADIAFVGGRLIWTLYRMLAGRPRIDPPWLLADFVRTSVLFRRSS